MRIRWFGQSAFLLSGTARVAIDPFGDVESRARERGLRFAYPRIEGVDADLLLITHEHFDHNAAEVAGGDPVVLRSTAGKLDSPVGEVVAIASEHDDQAGTARGPNTIFCFTLGGLRLCHMGDFGQAALRDAQREAIGEADVLFAPVGGGPTIGGSGAADVVRAIAPRLVVPMHYRTDAVNFLEPPDAFLEALGARTEAVDGAEAEIDPFLGTPGDPAVLLLTPPGA
jgi:L-ascorbate metabolism protein UlaG (beta-lactamase superfamily)